MKYHRLSQDQLNSVYKQFIFFLSSKGIDKKHWDSMTTDWVTLVEKSFESQLKGDGKDEARSIFSTHAKKTWDEYQKENLTKEELEVLNKALGTQINKTRFKDFCRKLYSYGSEWNE